MTAFLLTVHGQADPVEPAVQDGLDLACPVCGKTETVGAWAEDGEADLADWWDCQIYGGGCGAHGALVRRDNPAVTQNGVTARGVPAGGWAVERPPFPADRRSSSDGASVPVQEPGLLRYPHGNFPAGTLVRWRPAEDEGYLAVRVTLPDGSTAVMHSDDVIQPQS